jgi:hypothetical protein
MLCHQVGLRVIGGSNMIRGFLIFLMFICKKSVWISTKKKHPKFLKIVFFPINKLFRIFGKSGFDLTVPATQPFQAFPMTSSRSIRRTNENPI